MKNKQTNKPKKKIISFLFFFVFNHFVPVNDFKRGKNRVKIFILSSQRKKIKNSHRVKPRKKTYLSQDNKKKTIIE